MRTPLVAGNWKLHGSRESAPALARGVVAGTGALDSAVTVVICPAFVHLAAVAEQVAGTSVQLGAQDAADQQQGAFTGEVSANMLAECGCGYAIVGHSERRALYAESDELVARKFSAVRTAGLVPILCVGETLEQRRQGSTEAVVERQLAAVLAGNEAAFGEAVVAYEPVWAIGTGETATPDQAQAVHAFIRNLVARAGSQAAEEVRILYGGSVKPGNAAELMVMPDIDGGLIGGASLEADDFVVICQAAGSQ